MRKERFRLACFFGGLFMALVAVIVIRWRLFHNVMLWPTVLTAIVGVCCYHNARKAWKNEE